VHRFADLADRGGAAMTETADQMAKRIAAQRQARRQALTQWECKQINRQLRQPVRREHEKDSAQPQHK
jgi:hypothetical protein